MRRLVFVFCLLFILGARLVPGLETTALPTRPDSVKFAAIGDNGTGDTAEYDVGTRMREAHDKFPFELVIMLGDNMYGRQSPADFVSKFEHPYAALLQKGVVFYASLGNHDNPANRFYEGFNMAGQRYYTFVRRNVRFFALDSNQMDPQQLAWLADTLRTSTEEWKICYFHHPLYSDGGRHGSDIQLRVALEPLLIRYGVNVVLSGHDHVYERIKPQKGITYFVNGSSGELRRGDVHQTSTTGAYFDQDQAFSMFEVTGSALYFQAVSRSGKTVDSGVIQRQATAGEP